MVLSFAMNDVHIEQPYDTLHVDLFNNISKAKLRKNDVDLTLSLDDK